VVCLDSPLVYLAGLSAPHERDYLAANAEEAPLTPTEQYFVYPTNADGRMVLKDPKTGSQVPVEPDRIVRGMRRHKGKAHLDWQLISSFRLMRPDDLVWFYAAPDAELYAVAFVKRVYQRGSEWRLEVEWDRGVTELLAAEPIACSQGPQSPQRANAATRKAISVWDRKHQALA
jgi:hypothetical protein